MMKAIVFLVFAVFASAAACNWRHSNELIRVSTSGDPERGRAAIQTHGCITCHTITDIGGANGLVGPPLDNVGNRVYLAGRITNTPQNMAHWIRFPREVDPETVMPQMDLSTEESLDITAYLYSIREK